MGGEGSRVIEKIDVSPSIHEKVNCNIHYAHEKRNMKVQQFHEAIDSLIAVNKMIRYCYVNEHTEWIIRDYCTIMVGAGRATGKTFYIKDRASDKDVVIVGKQYMKPIFGKTEADIFYCGEIGYTEKVYDTVYVDNASEVDIDWVYKVFGKNIDQTFIFLG